MQTVHNVLTSRLLLAVPVLPMHPIVFAILQAKFAG